MSFLKSHLPPIITQPTMPAESESVSTGAETALQSPSDDKRNIVPEVLAPAVETVFRPTELMCKIKARLHSRFEPSARALTIADLTRADMIRITGSSTILDWWKVPGFGNWLINPVYNEEKLEWLETLTYNALEDILLNADPKAAGAKLNAAKLILEMRGKIKAKGDGVTLSTTTSVDKVTNAVSGMTSEDLIKIIDVSKKRV